MTDYISNIKLNNEIYQIGGDNFDGQWVKKHTTIVSGTSWKSKTNYNYSLSSYLPDDDYDYEVLLNTSQWTDSTSGHYISIRATGPEFYVIGVESKTRTSSNRGSRSNFRLLVKADNRTITIQNTGSCTASSCNIYARAYRRIGKNPNTGTNLISNIKTGGKTYPIGGNSFDGQWIYKYVAAMASKTLTSDQTVTYSLANYLPDDGYNYEVIIYYYIRTASKSGNSCGFVFYSGSTSGIALSCRYINTRVANSMIDAGNCILPVFANAKSVVLKQDGNATSGACGFSLGGYRRIGTNI